MNINISIRRSSKICLVVVNEFWTLLLGVKSKKLGIRQAINKCQKKEDKAETDRGSYYKQEEWLEAFLDDKSAFFNGSESDDSDNDD